ncbi:hypothetical protein SAMN05216337_1001231 [Bradyrhizobium brasilense]|uniref:Uncharacterized protein n=1 Tax=Bradyrhizobium brasilense TaxID=1419277 RepID=A0A1G6IRM1_9BRAD|nr:hypothetical protein [Bradyrhizobium brasilense]SDC09147.1 hypothetical protein SAMN05216337_1001231 [Bradyrhizobium brasilense]
MAKVFRLPDPADVWQFTVEVSRRPDGQHAARLVDCRASLIETGNTASAAKLREIADLLEQGIVTMRADADALTTSHI